MKRFNELNTNEINQKHWLEQNIYRTFENPPKQSKWVLPEAAEDEFLIEKSPGYSAQIDPIYFNQWNKSHYTTLEREL